MHAFSGYALTSFLIMRILWGLFGSDQGKFSRFLFKPSEILQHARAITTNTPKHYHGHSPVGSLMVFALLIMLSFTVALGLCSQAWTEYEGPFWFLGMMPSDYWGRFSENVHELLPNILIVLIIFHLLGVILACFQHHENLVSAMIKGYKSH